MTLAGAALRELPLLVTTPPAWAELALMDLPALLSDHAHLERKAASNALALLHRWPEGLAPGELSSWSNELVDIARDETAHLALVLEQMQKIGARFEKNHQNSYAKELRECETRGEDPRDLLDRLLVSALIEARSCERFYLLAELAPQPALRKLYHGLWSSEHGHYRTFIKLAEYVYPRHEVALRWQVMLEHEANTIQKQAPGSRMHSWVT